MQFQRVICCTLVILGWSSLQVFAQPAYPSKPIRVVVPYVAGGGNDTMGRLVAQKLTENFKQQAIVDNRGSAAGRVGTEHVAKSAPDGYTLLLAGSTVMITAPALYSALPYDVQKDFAPITTVAYNSYVLVVHPAVPARSVQQFIALCRSRPGVLNYSSSGAGGPAHLAGELFQALAKVKMLHIPYKGGAPALTDVIAGQIQMLFSTLLQSQAQLKAGRLRALAVTTAKRSPAAPELPTLQEAGVPGYEVAGWYGMMAPAKTPQTIVARLNREIVKILHTRDVGERLSADGSEPVGSTPQQFGAHIKSEVAKWKKVV
ncbi:MAG: tripartite tricarboxylate transporter substrate binding protein, partial [Sulfuricaulis sp.]|nr:tripartite tricarboxylate transporter substrate binding protein [Sulfuricaulis sp.]